MDNPYSAPALTPELVKEERRRPKLWRALLVAYAVHHAFAVLGLVTGVLIAPSERQEFFPRDNSLDCLQMVVVAPMFNLFLVFDPFIATMLGREELMVFRWLRVAFTLTVPVMVIWYGLSRRRELLWLIGIVTFALFLSFVVSFAADRRALRGSAPLREALEHEQAQFQSFAAEAVPEVALLGFAGTLDDDLEQLGRAGRIWDWGFRIGDLACCGHFVIGHLDFLRHSDFVIRIWQTRQGH